VFRAEVERLIAAMKALPREPGVAEILVPGERGDRAFERRTRDGIPISRATFDDLVVSQFGICPSCISFGTQFPNG
jgi:LDH2 family malate/lactate/ureidoglycolate dehydrogenase